MASILHDLEDCLVVVNVEMTGVSKRVIMDKKVSPIIVEAYIGELRGTVCSDPPGAGRDKTRVLISV